MTLFKEKRSVDLGYIYMYSWKKEDDLVPDWWEDDIPDKDEIILRPNTKYELTIDYPLNVPFVTEIQTDNAGMTRQAFVELVTMCYRNIYKEEDETTDIEPGHIPGMLNRISTNGKYGIWGHDLSDLDLHHVTVIDEKYLTLGVDS